MKNQPQSAFLSDLRPPRYFSIASGRPFLADLADGLIAAFGEDLALAEIYLPTRRAARALGDAILHARAKAGVRAALLPRMRAIGDIDEEEMVAFAGDAEDELALPPAISGTARLLALARLVAAKERAFAGQENWPAALAAAGELAKLIDSLYAEELDPARLAGIDAGDRAAHWRISADFLKIVTAAWPAYLEEAGLSDPAWRRAALIGAKADRLLADPPSHPLIIAGTTASAPAVARLVAAIAAAPRGAAVLPGVDQALDPAGYRAVEDAHPQFGLKKLLQDIGRTPADIACWPGSSSPGPRAGLLRLALRPANATEEWRTLIDAATSTDPALARAREGLSLIEAETEDAEASIVAMLFREALETEGATAMLVTPDRALARRVALKMRRWNVIVDDSGGVPFSNSPCGTYLRLVAGFLADPDDPVAILALLRHPLARLGLDEALRTRGVDALDRTLRGARSENRLAAAAREEMTREQPEKPMLDVIAALTQAAARYQEAAAGGGFTTLMRAHLDCAERLGGGAALWSGDDGATGAEVIASVLAEEAALGAVTGARYQDVFDALIAGAVVRRRSEAHPRLSILGPLEARLMSADHVILGGLNEGVWPQVAPPDPFLSRTMREAVGLPSPERRIGLSAHDFAQAAASPRVTLTRAKKAGGKPAKPSRWIVRLRNILKGAGALGAADQSALWTARAERLDAAAAARPATPPRPRAGKDRRPAKLSVTEIETFIRDPYAIYARHLLCLRKLDDPSSEIGAREAGTLIHQVFERAGAADALLPIEELRAILDEEARRDGFSDAELAFWADSFEEALGWFHGFDAQQRARGRAVVETKGSLTLAGIDPPFTLTAKADRIDVLFGGGAELYDFKTGALPTEKQEKADFSPQLALTGLILEHGGFDGVPAAPVAAYAYLKALGRSEKEAKNLFRKDADDAAGAVRDAEAGLRKWIAHFDDPSSAYLSKPRAQFIRRGGPENKEYQTDYDQLARRRAWIASEDNEE